MLSVGTYGRHFQVHRCVLDSHHSYKVYVWNAALCLGKNTEITKHSIRNAIKTNPVRKTVASYFTSVELCIYLQKFVNISIPSLPRLSSIEIFCNVFQKNKLHYYIMSSILPITWAPEYIGVAGISLWRYNILETDNLIVYPKFDFANKFEVDDISNRR